MRIAVIALFVLLGLSLLLAGSGSSVAPVLATPPISAARLHLPAPAAITATVQLSATVAAPVSLPPVAAPLRPLTITLALPGYSGPAELHLYDAHQRAAGQMALEVRQGQASVVVLPRGALGMQRGVVLIDGQQAGELPDLFRLDAQTELHTGQADLDALYPTVRAFLEQKVISYTLDDSLVRGYRSPDNPLLWLRDHVYQGRGFRYFEQDMTSLLDAFRRAQRPDGSFPDVLDYPALSIAAHRLDTESDLEFLFVQGVYEAWQATGDDAWLRRNLAAMRRGLEYITSNPLRWDAESGLVRRPYTIDMWDFAYGPTTTSPDGQPAPRHWIDDQTIWGIFHGDNTGLAYALRLMERMERHLGNDQQAERWQELRRAMTRRLNERSWNGEFFTHFVPLTGTLDVPGVDTDEQLSLSNAYALNREVLEFQQGRDIIDTYFRRRNFDRAFAEWYSIDPPFPAGSYGMAGKKGEQPGEYVNGGIMPLAGGELARGAFRYGAEDYGFDILRRYADLLRLTGKSYLWYYPNGNPGISGPDTVATDGWGSSAMLAALIEGAAGVQDSSRRYREIDLRPRWSAVPEITAARVVARYGASDGYVAYSWQRGSSSIALDITGSWQQAHIRLLLPAEAKKHDLIVRLNGRIVPTRTDNVADSRYILIDAAGSSATVAVLWWQPEQFAHLLVQQVRAALP